MIPEQDAMDAIVKPRREESRLEEMVVGGELKDGKEK